MSLPTQDMPNRRPSAVCYDFLNSSCRREQCPYLHERGNTPGPPVTPTPPNPRGRRKKNKGKNSQPGQGPPALGQTVEASSGPINSPPPVPKRGSVLNIRPSQQIHQRQNGDGSSRPTNPPPPASGKGAAGPRPRPQKRGNSEAGSRSTNPPPPVPRQAVASPKTHPQQTPQRGNGEASSNPPLFATRQGVAAPRRPQKTSQRGGGWGKYADWADRLSGMKQSAAQIRFLWEEALDITEGADPNLTQKVAERLVERDNIGRQLIEQVVDNDYSGPSTLDYLLTSVPFLLFLTHQNLVNSISIDRQVGTLYNYLHGTDGNMCARFFSNLAAQLEREMEAKNRRSNIWKSALLGNPPSFSKAFASVVEGLRHTLRRNQSAGFNEAYKIVAESFCALANLVPQHDEFYSSISSSLTEVIGIHRRANLIIVAPTPPVPQDTGTNTVLSSFPVEIDFPEYLSTNGPRHDNDFVSIREISLLPTLDEILSERGEFLPYKSNSYPHFLTGVDRLFDTHFRLLRHDNIAGLKDAVGTVFALLQLPTRERSAAFKNATRKIIQGNFYDDASVVKAKFDKMRGLELVLRFLQPQAIVNKAARAQMKWWDDQKKRFDKGTLACLVTSSEDFRRATFLTITHKEVSPGREDGLAAGRYGHISVQIAEPKKWSDDINFILERLSPFAPPAKSVLLEFPGIIPATFLPVLGNLQGLSARGTLPLSQWIAPSAEGILLGSNNNTENLPPAYSRSAEFRWDLKPILKNRSAEYFLSSTTKPENNKILDDMEKLTTLDRGQCKALLTGLTKEMSLIQGPPGTGKSYVGVQLVSVLLHNKKRTKIGPIVCVCYTNHALDQFLEELLKQGVDKIIRVGGQSKSTEMEGKNLHAVSRAEKKTRIERSSVALHHQRLEEIHRKAERLCREVSRRPDSWDAVDPIMKMIFPDLHRQLLDDYHTTFEEGSEGNPAEALEEDDNLGGGVELAESNPESEGELPDGVLGSGLGFEDGNYESGEESENSSIEVEEKVEEVTSLEMENGWEQVSKPQDIWDGWRGVRKGAAWKHRNANAKEDPHPTRTLEEIAECDDIWSMPWAERAVLVAYLSERAATSPVARLATLVQGQATELSELGSQNQEVNRRCLEKADVIGVTTAGLARQIALLSRVNAKVVICEEAAEVLEAHLINAILPTCQHLIQIGDHQQLRPQISNFDLSLESRGGKVHSLDESMFERLVKENKELAPAQLNIQRRMHPEISALIRYKLYPYLQDHDCVRKYPDVVGMRKNIFWLDHTYPEDSGDNTSQVRSRSNDWEVRMTYGLVRHLIRQSHYDSKDIAVLTPYTAQLQKLRNKLRASFEVILSEKDEEALARDGLEEGEEELEPVPVRVRDPRQVGVTKGNLLDALRVATVDNFQGEEAKIVVISLVRSNTERSVGFLRTENRINVLLSRAKHGMYLIGNAENAGSVPMWRDVCQILRDNEAIGTQLALVCPRHRDTPIHVDEPDDFLRLSPEGGCDLPCDKRLEGCGHRCFSKCHSDGMHRAVACAQQCNLLLPICRHPCQNLCSEKCGRCMTPVKNFQLRCGHVEEIIQCWRTLPEQVVICTRPVMKIIPGCGHAVKKECFFDVYDPSYKCPATCGHILPCSHPCKGTCGTCNTVVEGKKHTRHGACKRLCGRKFTTCNHTCSRPCHDGSPCGLCNERCDVKCEHSRCIQKCQEDCAPCAEPCAWVCKHQGRCLMPCAAPCERFPCDERCDKTLACGHRCPSVCGERCPGVEFCQICCSEDRKGDLGVDMVEFLPYNSIDLDENPILVLSCGHFFTRETLDGYLELYTAYSMDNQGNYAGYIDPEGVLDEQTRKCPTCRKPLRQFSVRRYGRVINRAAIMEMTRRFLASTSNKYKSLSDTLSQVEYNIIESRDTFLAAISSPAANNTQTEKDWLLKTRLEAINQVYKSLCRFISETESLRQPATKLYENTITRKTSLNIPETQIEATLYFRPDTRLVLLAKILKIRATLLNVTERTLLAHHLRDIKASNTGNMLVFSEKVSQVAQLTLADAFITCRRLISSSKAQHLPGAEVETITIFAKLAAIWRQLPESQTIGDKSLNRVVEEARIRLERADELCEEEEFARVDEKKELLAAVRRQLNSGTFYQEVSKQEMAAVVRAMRTELSVRYAPTGHWYYCQNGHPFTIGECGRPMEEIKCPECNAPVGGRNHSAASGVQSADDLEAIANRA